MSVTFKLGDYVKHVDEPKSVTPFRLVEDWHVDVVNAQSKNFQYSSKEEYNKYWSEDE